MIIRRNTTGSTWRRYALNSKSIMKAVGGSRRIAINASNRPIKPSRRHHPDGRMLSHSFDPMRPHQTPPLLVEACAQPFTSILSNPGVARAHLEVDCALSHRNCGAVFGLKHGDCRALVALAAAKCGGYMSR